LSAVLIGGTILSLLTLTPYIGPLVSPVALFILTLPTLGPRVAAVMAVLLSLAPWSLSYWLVRSWFATNALVRELLEPYYSRVTLEDERYDERKGSQGEEEEKEREKEVETHRAMKEMELGLKSKLIDDRMELSMVGFGMCQLLLLSVPIVGPIFLILSQGSAAILFNDLMANKNPSSGINGQTQERKREWQQEQEQEKEKEKEQEHKQDKQEHKQEHKQEQEQFLRQRTV